MAIFATCCGCITVESGTTLVGIFSFMASAITLVSALPTFPHSPRLDFDLDQGKTLIFKTPKPGQNPRETKAAVLHLSYMLMTILVTINMVSSMLLLMGVKHRNRFLLLPWILWTAFTIALCQIWMVLTSVPVIIGDLPCLVLFIWAELCVISHYQNLRDGVRETDLLECSREREERFLEDLQRGSGSSGHPACESVFASNPVGLLRLQRHLQAGLRTAEAESQPGNTSPVPDPPPPYPGNSGGDVSNPDGERTRSPKLHPLEMDSSPPPCYEDCFIEQDQEGTNETAEQTGQGSHMADPDQTPTSPVSGTASDMQDIHQDDIPAVSVAEGSGDSRSDHVDGPDDENTTARQKEGC